MLKKGDKKLINGWAFYDWANSVYSLVISTTVFPMYYEAVTNEGGNVQFLGTHWHNTTLYSYALGLSFLIVAFLSPILSAIADYTGNKKRFMQFFCLLGSISVMSLFFFTGKENIWVGIIFSMLASIGFWGSIVFYNAYLPEVADPEDHDRVSAKGFMLGYAGSVLLLAFNLSMVMKPELYGITDSTLPARISFLSVGIWWFGFAQITFSRLPNNPFKRKPEKNFIFKGYRELQLVLKEIKTQGQLKILLISFFLYSIGVQAVILLASTFGTKDLGLEDQNLIITILLIQLVGILGAFLFSRLSKKIGNIKALKITVVIWAFACFGAYTLHKDDPSVYLKFYALGGFIGLVFGAIQTLSRSTYSKLIPDNTQDHATYFSFYDVTEKIAIVVGMAIAGVVTSFTNSLRLFILILAVFFIAGFIALSFMKKTKYVK
ncbi:UMF1 family MFS transporter [Lutibacter oceani]|uniref:UMF1 family MFS transporter n=1 Tax=Lutibacter oceani TaxID=1853311 RepID=A0A3D9S0W1_9FLAO|nr:MFS transporter [Lutibacter oceani]REE82332.1 UMF1 family MFS transporter [Lutibacter oceani]